MSGFSSAYPDDIQGWQVCKMEGCDSIGPCPRCGETNYRLMGYYGAIGRWAKAWNVSKDEAEKCIIANQMARAEKRGLLEEAEA